MRDISLHPSDKRCVSLWNYFWSPFWNLKEKHQKAFVLFVQLADDLKNVMDQMDDKDHFVQQLPAEKQTLFKTFLKNPTEITGLTQDRKVGFISLDFFAFRN